MHGQAGEAVTHSHTSPFPTEPIARVQTALGSRAALKRGELSER